MGSVQRRQLMPRAPLILCFVLVVAGAGSAVALDEPVVWRDDESGCAYFLTPRAASLLASDVTALRTVPTRVSPARRSSTTPYAGWDAAWITCDARWTTASAIASVRRGSS